MQHKILERFMLIISGGTLIWLLVYTGLKHSSNTESKIYEKAKYFNNILTPLDSFLNFLGVYIAVLSLGYLLISIRLSAKAHRQQMHQMEMIDRRNYLTECMFAASSNVFFHREHELDSGIYLFKNSRQSGDDFCAVLWNIEYRSKKRDSHYVFKIFLMISSTKKVFGRNLKVSDMTPSDMKNIINILKNSDSWNYAISVPRFEDRYGKIVEHIGSSHLNINFLEKMNFLEFMCILDAISVLQTATKDELAKQFETSKPYIQELKNVAS